MDRKFIFFTDTATLAVFDPQRLKHRVDANLCWWCTDFAQLDELQAGAAALVSLGSDGVYQARITDGSLTPDERDYAAEVVQNLGVEIVSGGLFLGPGECLPGGGSQFSAADTERGLIVELANGPYLIDVYSIHWFDSPRWWTDDRKPPQDAPADFVVLVRQRVAAFAGLERMPRFDGWTEAFLFESSARQVGPQPGMIFTTNVRKGASDTLALNDCGPCHYRASLVDYSRVKWKDTIRFKVLTVDHESQTMTGEFLEVVRET